MGGGDFQPCALDAGVVAPIPGWERRLVLAALLIHVADVGLDLLVLLVFLTQLEWGFFCGGAGILVWAWLVSSLYVSFGSGADEDDFDSNDRGGLCSSMRRFLLNFAQVQIFVEAFHSIWHNGDTDFFYTLRLMESILEAAPSALWQLYVLLSWGGAPAGTAGLLSLSVAVSFASVGMGLAMWEQKVQFRASASYIASVGVMRCFEISSRSLTLAVFGAVARPHGFWLALLIDYAVMIFLLVRHRSLKFSYGLFVAIPLVLVSLEPLVWRWEDHAVPKDAYYLVRIVEFVAMWAVVIHKQESPEADEIGPRLGCEAVALLSTLGLYVALPLVWKVARQFELSREVVNWGDDGSRDGLNCSDVYYDSDEGGGDGSQEDECARPLKDGDLPAE